MCIERFKVVQARMESPDAGGRAGWDYETIPDHIFYVKTWPVATQLVNSSLSDLCGS